MYIQLNKRKILDRDLPVSIRSNSLRAPVLRIHRGEISGSRGWIARPSKGCRRYLGARNPWYMTGTVQANSNTNAGKGQQAERGVHGEYDHVSTQKPFMGTLLISLMMKLAEGQGRLVNERRASVRHERWLLRPNNVDQPPSLKQPQNMLRRPYVWMVCTYQFSGHDKKASAPPVNPVEMLQTVTLLTLFSRPLRPNFWWWRNMTSASCQESALRTILKEENEETNHTVDWTLSYAIPSILKSGINTIYPTVMFVFPPFSASTESRAQYLRSSRGSEQIGFCCKCDGNKPGANPPTASISSDCQVDWIPACLQQPVQYTLRAYSTGSKCFGGFRL
ncbi:hypothetical protein DFH08DRAFT_822494 [Mycena albidolilacea]|uniref:Uncharacterized protein n=1 Tax=Mycena albidolilacea TaxID=1033008 RepID=A0AAD6Z8H1_9AGAR|nr:hypothetical protein DFH08DRAFT_822494 [Mycena albidolilacea]